MNDYCLYFAVTYCLFCLSRNLVWCVTAANDSGRIYNGEYAKDGQFPYMAYISSRSNKMCGGTIINDDTILTAAHCVKCDKRDNNGDGWYTIIIGHLKPLNDADQNAHYESRACRRHEGYNEEHTRAGNDLALIKLKRKIDFGSDAKVGKSCLATEQTKLKNPNACQVVGWGQTNRPDKKVNHLEFAEIKLLTQSECGKKYNDQHFLCASGDNNGKDTCFGDSGGPLICQPEDTSSAGSEWLQLGITSHGSDKTCGPLPAFYTKVSRHVQWISQHAQED